MSAAAAAVGRGHLDPFAILDVGHPGVLEQGDAQAGCRTGLAERQVEGVQVAGAHVDHAADIAIRPHH